MEFKISSKSSSDDGSKSDLSYSFTSIKKVDTAEELEQIIRDAKNKGLKKVTIKDRRSSPIKAGYSDLFGTKVTVSLLPDKEKTYELELA
jgi:hypothetical protein